MISIIIGIVLVIIAVLMWVGHIPVEHALALLTGAIGVLILLGGFLPGSYFRRD
jgi:hypothetical protein